MSSDLEAYLAKVEERDNAAGYVGWPMDEDDWRDFYASQADVPTLVAMVRWMRAQAMAVHAAPTADEIRVLAADIVLGAGRLAREAMEKSGGD